ncbi:serine hydrolase [Luteitalea sp. TBR-22]|uniref:serine hydrolase domain-containing protein n=1 Tax=Luteitalea sp. TBR-22 TaxID=2802971 RepID=UPI001AF0B9C5|nr:serine hydrolase domain-containing protein [Luteitalea sp. TBR-22]BCS34869.1 serine hydrolase [Luteitalea sp. TBR-22]
MLAPVLRLVGAVAIATVLATPTSAQVAPAAAGLPTGSPAEAGLSPERLARLHGRLDRFVADGEIAGAVSIVARRGRVVDVHVTGLRDREQHLPMTRDTIVRVYSMSKIVTTVAALILVEEGRLRLDDPIARYLPALKSPKVFAGGTAARPRLVPATRPITIRHLLTHTSGFAYGLAESPVDDMYRAKSLLTSPTSDAFIEKVAALPLIAQPGQRFYYGVNTDVLGVIVEKVSGQRLGEFMQARIFGPLGMVDTAFVVPPEKRSRLANLYQRDGTAPLAVAGVSPGSAGRTSVPYPDAEGRLFHSGGGGLFSTADDYLRFAQMLLEGGALGGARILGRKTVETMAADQNGRLPERTPSHLGFGFGVAMRLDHAGGAPAGSIGEYGWSGAATTLVDIDPQERLVAVLLTQVLPYDQPQIFAVYRAMLNAAIE